MPRVTPAVAEASAGIPILEAGYYEFIIAEPKPFCRKKQEDDTINYGITFRIVDRNDSSKFSLVNLYLHTKEALGMAKQFLMAAYGFDPKDKAAEKEYSVQYPDEDHFFDYDETDLKVNEFGPVFHGAGGKLIAADVQVGANKKTGDQQNNFRWKTIA